MLKGEAKQIGFLADQTDGGAGDGDRLGEIILPVTPPVVLAPMVRIGLTPICCAVTACRLANSALLDVSEPVRNTPSQPRKGEKKGNSAPDAANASPRVEEMPE